MGRSQYNHGALMAVQATKIQCIRNLPECQWTSIAPFSAELGQCLESGYNDRAEVTPWLSQYM